MKEILEQLLDRQDLTRAQAQEVMAEIMSGEYDDAQIAGFLIALRAKEETVEEITGFAEAMRNKMVTVEIESRAIDMCGTGGDAWQASTQRSERPDAVPRVRNQGLGPL